MKKCFVTAKDSVYGTVADFDDVGSLAAGQVIFFNEDGSAVAAGATPTGDYITLAMGRASGGALLSAPIYGNDSFKYYQTAYAAGAAKVLTLGSAADALPINATIKAGDIYEVIVIDLDKEAWDLSRKRVITYVTTGAEANAAAVNTAIAAAINADPMASKLGTAAATAATHITFTSKADASKVGYYHNCTLVAGDGLTPAGTYVTTPIGTPVGSPYDVALAEKADAVERGYNPEPMGLEEGMWTNNWLTNPSDTYHMLVIASRTDKESARAAIDTEANFVQEIEIFVPTGTANEHTTLLGILTTILGKL